MINVLIKTVVTDDILQVHIYLDFHQSKMQDKNYGYATVVSFVYKLFFKSILLHIFEIVFIKIRNVSLNDINISNDNVLMYTHLTAKLKHHPFCPPNFKRIYNFVKSRHNKMF